MKHLLDNNTSKMLWKVPENRAVYKKEATCVLCAVVRGIRAVDWKQKVTW